MSITKKYFSLNFIHNQPDKIKYQCDITNIEHNPENSFLCNNVFFFRHDIETSKLKN